MLRTIALLIIMITASCSDESKPEVRSGSSLGGNSNNVGDTILNNTGDATGVDTKTQEVDAEAGSVEEKNDTTGDILLEEKTGKNKEDEIFVDAEVAIPEEFMSTIKNLYFMMLDKQPDDGVATKYAYQYYTSNQSCQEMGMQMIENNKTIFDAVTNDRFMQHMGVVVDDKWEDSRIVYQNWIDELNTKTKDRNYFLKLFFNGNYYFNGKTVCNDFVLSMKKMIK